MIGGGTAACSSDASRLGDPFTNPFSSMSSEPSATGSLADETQNDAVAPPAIRTPRVQSSELAAPGAAVTPRPAAIAPSYSPPVSGSVAGMNPDAGRAMSPRIAPPAPAPKLQFGQGPKPFDSKPLDRKAVEAEAKRQADARRLAEAEAKKAADLKAADLKAAEQKAAEARKAAEAKKLADAKKTAPTKTAPVASKEAAKVDPAAERKAEAARKAEAEAKLAKADAAKEAARKVAEAKAAEAAAKASTKSVKETKVAEKEPEKPAAATTKVATADPASTGTVSNESFRWPAKGRVINGYGSGGNEGINIAVPEGTPVKAAEDGTVAYAGSDVKGYGKLVLVRHNNGYVSAYAHNGELDVRPGEKVKRGQTIAKSGATGNVTSPQLHFEIRKGATPVDPIPHLASN